MTSREAIFPPGRHALYEKHRYSAAIRSGDLLFVSGQVGSRADGSPEPDFERQVRLAFDNLAAVLKAAGCTFRDVVDVTTFHTDPAAQFVALSSATGKTAEFGIDPSRVFGFEDWVGGRYSVWGPIGLSLMLAIGDERFDEFLAGGAAMDAHFRAAPLAENLPVLLALVGIWHHQICGYPTRAVLPYDNRLLRLPAYLQQLEMESNGKGVTTAGEPVPRIR